MIYKKQNWRGPSLAFLTTLLLVTLVACAPSSAPTSRIPENTEPAAAEPTIEASATEEAASIEAEKAGADGAAAAATSSDAPTQTLDADETTEEPQSDEAAAQATPFDPNAVSLRFEPLIEGLTRPTFATHAGDGSGRLFLLEQPGVIRIWRDGALLEQPFLDIQEQVEDGGNEQGLLGLAFAPDYAESGLFWINYTDLRGNTVVARFNVSDDPNVADATSEFPVLQIEQPARNHNGGMITFGPDGYLWIGTGDGGAANDRFNNGQNPNTLLGKMLRLDVTSDLSQPYTIPSDNPWVAADWNGADVRDEIWAVGLRNPWRFSFDRATDALWIADVGQNQYEEVNFTASLDGGDNYGWPIMEGAHCFARENCEQAGLVQPVAEYDHSGHCSVTGGYVYRGEAQPALDGVYFFADFCSGVMWATYPDASGEHVTSQVLETGLQISSFVEDEAGELYVISLGGEVQQLVAE